MPLDLLSVTASLLDGAGLYRLSCACRRLYHAALPHLKRLGATPPGAAEVVRYVTSGACDRAALLIRYSDDSALLHTLLRAESGCWTLLITRQVSRGPWLSARVVATVRSETVGRLLDSTLAEVKRANGYGLVDPRTLSAVLGRRLGPARDDPLMPGRLALAHASQHVERGLPVPGSHAPRDELWAFQRACVRSGVAYAWLAADQAYSEPAPSSEAAYRGSLDVQLGSTLVAMQEKLRELAK